MQVEIMMQIQVIRQWMLSFISIIKRKQYDFD